MTKIRLLLLLTLVIGFMASCEEDPLTYPGLEPNADLYGVGLTNVLAPGSFLSVYIDEMTAAEDAVLTDVVVTAQAFATAHMEASINYFVPTGNITMGTLLTSSEPVAGSETGGEVLVYYFSKGGDSIAYQLSKTAEGYLHEGFTYSNGSFTKSLVANEVIADTTGTITDIAANESTTWSYNLDSMIVERSARDSSVVMKMNVVTNGGEVFLTVNNVLRVESTWAGDKLEGVGAVYDATGALDFTDTWPLIEVPAGFENYRIMLFNQTDLYATTQSIKTNLGDCVVASGCGGDNNTAIPDAWGNYSNWIPVLANIMYIPETATVEVTPSGLQRTYSYTAIEGESVVYQISASPSAYRHVVTVDGVLKYNAEEDRDSSVKETFVKEEGSEPGFREFYMRVGDTFPVSIIGRYDGQTNCNWIFRLDINNDNSGVISHEFDCNGSGLEFDTHVRTNWRRARFTANAASGDWWAIQGSNTANHVEFLTW